VSIGESVCVSVEVCVCVSIEECVSLSIEKTIDLQYVKKDQQKRRKDIKRDLRTSKETNKSDL